VILRQDLIVAGMRMFLAFCFFNDVAAHYVYAMSCICNQRKTRKLIQTDSRYELNSRRSSHESLTIQTASQITSRKLLTTFALEIGRTDANAANLIQP